MPSYPTFEPTLWNDPVVIRTTNWYAYAANE